MSRWITIDATKPLRSLRAVAGLSQRDGAVALLRHRGQRVDPDDIDGGDLSTLTSGETRGTSLQYAMLLERAEAFDLEIEIRVRKRPVSDAQG